MGFLDRFRRHEPNISREQLCYDIAYRLLPHHAFHDFDKIVEMISKIPNAARTYFYIMACVMSKIEPVEQDATQFAWHTGALVPGHECWVLEYPAPALVDLSNVDPEDLVSRHSKHVLAPHFSMIARADASAQVSYFALGQAPVGGGTTLRRLTRDGINANLGPGPEPRLELFLRAVESRLAT